MWIRPISPEAMRRRASANPVSKRRWKPIWSGTPHSFTTASARSVEGTSRAIGFSQKMAFLARAAASIWPAWAPVGVTITTASTSLSRMASCASAIARAP